MSTLDLIKAIEAGSAIGIEEAFNQNMAERISERLDVMRQDIARNMFNSDSVVVEEELEEGYLSEEEFEALSEEEKADYKPVDEE